MFEKYIIDKNWQCINGSFPIDSFTFKHIDLNKENFDVITKGPFVYGFKFNANKTISYWTSGYMECDIGNIMIEKSNWQVEENRLTITMKGKQFGYDNFDYTLHYVIAKDNKEVLLILTKQATSSKNESMLTNKIWVLNSYDFPADTIKFRLYNAKKDKNEVGFTYQFLNSGEMVWSKIIPPGRFVCNFRARDLFKGNWEMKTETLHIVMESGYYGEWRDKYDLNYSIQKLNAKELILIKTEIK